MSLFPVPVHHENRHSGRASEASSRHQRRSHDQGSNRREQLSDSIPSESPWIRRGNLSIDVSIILLLVAAPLCLGGRHPIGRAVLIAAAIPGSLGLLVLCLSGRGLRVSRWHGCLMVIALAIPALQTVPLGAEFVTSIHRGWSELFPNPTMLVPLEQLAQTVSISKTTTQDALPLVVAYLCIFVFVSERIRSRRDAEQILIFGVLAVSCLAAVALLQVQWGNGKFLWVYDHPTRSPGDIPRGPFQNENHLSHFLALGLPGSLYMLFRSSYSPRHKRSSSKRTSESRAATGRKRSNSGFANQLQRERVGHANRVGPLRSEIPKIWLGRFIALLGFTLVVATVFATPSRGGAAVVAATTGIWVMLAGLAKVSDRTENRFGHNNKMMRYGMTAFLAILTLGIAGVFLNIESLSYWRSQLWRADLEIWHDFPWLGVGVGNHQYVYRAYLHEYFPQTFSTAESSWIQYLVETGAVGILTGIAIVIAVLSVPLRSLLLAQGHSQTLLVTSVLAALIGSLTHSFFDFPWHIPACFTFVIVLAAVAIRTHGWNPNNTAEKPASLASYVSVTLAAGLLFLNVWALRESTPAAYASVHWDNYLRLARDQTEGDKVDASVSDPDLASGVELLAKTLQADPTHHRSRAKLLFLRTAEFESHLGHPASSKARGEWLLQQCRLGMSLTPMESRYYTAAGVVTSNLGRDPEEIWGLFEQAQRLRQVDGHNALRMGILALAAQRIDAAEQQFDRALNQDPSYGTNAVGTIAMLYPLSTILEKWSPDRPVALELYHIATERDDNDAIQQCGGYLCDCLIREANETYAARSRHLLSLAAKVAAKLGDTSLQLRINDEQLRSSGENAELLVHRAEIHLQAGELDQARQDLRHCRDRFPRSQAARRLALQLDRQAAGIQTR